MSLFKKFRTIFNTSQKSSGSNLSLDEELTSSSNISELESKFGYTFRNKNILTVALCHRSIQNSTKSDGPVSNERLEFLGDSVLGMVISEYLYSKYPDFREGKLTKLKGSLVSEAVLFKVAKSIDFGKHLLMSKDEHKSGGRNRKTILADGYEAVLGAIYLDGGLEPAINAIKKHILEKHKTIISGDEHANYKGKLLEYMQGQGWGVPRYEVVDESGPEHKKSFKVVAKIRGKRMGYGIGDTKKEAERRAAKVAFDKLNSD
ncbi:MAG: ribonuclease III [candidate division Zixibacteria bacterium]|nr:ribonuclease III [candidate division Zixibacteria bacterium]